MKNCSYCGRENTDTATHCIGCGTGEFTDAAAKPDRGGISDQEHATSDALVRDYPKPIIVVGLWMFFLPGLLANLSVAFAALFGELGVLPGVFCFFISLGCAALCAYALCRAVKNYQIHRDRLSREISGEAPADADSLATPSPS